MPDPEPSSPEAGLALDISIECEGWSAAVSDPEKLCLDAASAALAALEDVPGRPALSILLSDDTMIATLNSQFRGKNGPTNVLSFPAGDTYPDGLVMLGDIAVAFETVEREADAGGITIADHLSHMIIHGTLHLLGFDHETDGEAEEMENLETSILSGLGVADPYAETKVENAS